MIDSVQVITVSIRKSLSEQILTLNIYKRKGLCGFILLSFKYVYAKLSWSLDVKRSTSLNQRQENKFDIGVWALTINEPSGTSAKHIQTKFHISFMDRK